MTALAVAAIAISGVIGGLVWARILDYRNEIMWHERERERERKKKEAGE